MKHEARLWNTTRNIAQEAPTDNMSLSCYTFHITFNFALSFFNYLHNTYYVILIFMTPEERQILIQTHRMVEENNHLIRKMRRAALWGRVWTILYWTVIIGASVGAYYFIQPYVEQVQGVYGGLKQDLNNVRGTVDKVSDTASKIGDIGGLFPGGGN